MAAPNFYVFNAQNYYVIEDKYIDKDDNGIDQEYVRTDIDFEDFFNDIRYAGEEDGLFPHYSDEYCGDLEAEELCRSDDIWDTFGKSKKAWTTETAITSTICVRCGRYCGMVLDYDIRITTSQGDTFKLSEYDNIDWLLKDYLNTIEDIVVWKGDLHNWTRGTFKIQRDNIKKWIENRIQEEIDKCEKFCRENCDNTYNVYARFSNGETWYVKVG